MTSEVVCENKECGSWCNYRCIFSNPILINENGHCMTFWKLKDKVGVKGK